MALSLEELRRFRTLTIIALFSDDDLLDTLVLKGGNALDIGYGMNSRASIDLDFSMSQDFENIGLTNLEEVRQRLEFVLSRTFFDNGFKVFDVKMISKPKTRTPKTPYFWAGYGANFKVIENDKFEAHKNEPVWLTNKSIAVSDTKKNISIDFGMHEYLGDITTAELDGYIVPIYTPTLIVLEKLRAVCQQMAEYNVSIGKEANFGKARPRDFFDIYTVLESSLVHIDFNHPDTIRHLKACFQAKNVPIELIAKIPDTLEFHKQDEIKLRDSVVGSEFKGFDFYFNYVVDLLLRNNLHILAA
ncbi:nucleotidyl transferase AbiEii/AbiGii toxin family protein [Paenibacillus sp. KS-LC4]|uniref:nucleotidyl transferase AbiEii/AbiGii toxin family protein n=1 Tax=Paenibacillus sp. KS-LC4 TaxID=2979727 RepID=UPI0030CD5B09